MITYEEAKEIAVEIAGQIGATLDVAKEWPQAYVFDDSKHQYAGWIPMVIQKSDGGKYGYWHYMNEHNLKSDDLKDIPF